MSELIVEQVTETVIEITDGPTLSTTVDETVVTVIHEQVDPVIIDLNSGPRGEPGAAIHIGTYPPLATVGVVGDMYIVTQGSTLVGQVFRKITPYTWEDVGNVRGPAGGVNTVNGYTGPDVTLVKADVGLGSVDNTSDLAKPVSTAQQAALDLKANDNAVVKLTGNQSVAGVKTFVSAPVVPLNSFAIDKINGLQAALNLKAVDTAVVHLAGTETITGAKTFSAGLTALSPAAAGPKTAINLGSGYGSGTAGVVDNLKLRIYDNGAATYGIGISAARMEYQANQAGGRHTFYIEGAEVLNLGAGAVALTGATTITGTLNVSGVITGNGSGLTTLNGSNISSGTVADARLSTNVLLLTGAQTITAVKTFSVSPIVPTPTTDTQAANKVYVDGRVAALANSAPALLDTLDELAAALGDDPNFATTVTNSIATKEPIIVAGTTAQYWRGDKTWQTLNKAAVGLANVDNTSDAAKPISTATQTALNAKEGTITAGTTAQYYRGDKTWQTLNSVTVDLSSVQTIGGAKTFSSLLTASAGITVTGTVTATTFSGSGASLTALNGTNISTGTVADARLSTNVALLTGIQTFSGAKTFSALITASAGVTVTGTVTATTFSGSGASLTALNGSNISTGTVPQARLVQNIRRIEHGATAGTARPTGATYVEWVGSVQPTNMIAGDTWINTGTLGNTPEMYPAGTVVASALVNANAPTGWYWCEGQQIAIASDQALYDALTLTELGTRTYPYGGNTNGSGGAGSTHFRLPNMKGKVIAHGDGTTEFAAPGTVFGEKYVTLTMAQIPNASGNIVAHGTVSAFWQPSGVFGASGQTNIYSVPASTTGGATSITSIHFNLGGGGGSHNNIQPTMTMRYMIKR